MKRFISLLLIGLSLSAAFAVNSITSLGGDTKVPVSLNLNQTIQFEVGIVTTDFSGGITSDTYIAPEDSITQIVLTPQANGEAIYEGDDISVYWKLQSSTPLEISLYAESELKKDSTSTAENEKLDWTVEFTGKEASASGATEVATESTIGGTSGYGVDNEGSVYDRSDNFMFGDFGYVTLGEIKTSNFLNNIPGGYTSNLVVVVGNP